MNARLNEIQIKRARLLERAAQEREDVAQALQSWSQPLAFVDRCLAVVNFVVSRPPLLAGAALLLALLRPRRALRWARRAWGLWRTYRWLANKVAA